MPTSAIVFWVGIALVALGSCYRRNALGSLGIILGSTVAALGAVLALLTR